MVFQQTVGTCEPPASLAVYATKDQREPDPETATRRRTLITVFKVLVEGALISPNKLVLAPQHICGFAKALQLCTVQFAGLVLL
jgi:hypothetical protein